MITHIFYSLILFPNIKYFENKYGYNLIKIEEEKFGIFKLNFKYGNFYKKIFIEYFKINEIKDSKSLNYWNIYSEDEELINILFNNINDIRFDFLESTDYISKIPFGVVFTITPKCNIACDYCFNDHEFDLENRNSLKHLSLEDCKYLIDQIYDAGTRDIIISGGEPFVYPYLYELLDYIKYKGMYIRINTNGTLLSYDVLSKLNQYYPCTLMVSMHEFNGIEYGKVQLKGFREIHKINNFKLSFFQKKFNGKIEKLKLVSNFENINLEFLTILTPKNILKFEKIYRWVINNFDISFWHFFRLYCTEYVKGIDRGFMKIAIDKLYKLNNLYNKDFKIVDAVPFCSNDDIYKSNKVVEGELDETHNVKGIVTTDGGFQVMSAFDKKEGNLFETNIKDIRNSNFVQGMLKNDFLPRECEDCVMKAKCKGGSRMESNIVKGSYYSFDPIGDINAKVKDE